MAFSTDTFCDQVAKVIACLFLCVFLFVQQQQQQLGSIVSIQRYTIYQFIVFPYLYLCIFFLFLMIASGRTLKQTAGN